MVESNDENFDFGAVLDPPPNVPAAGEEEGEGEVEGERARSGGVRSPSSLSTSASSKTTTRRGQ